MPAGNVSAVQVDPPFVVPMAAGLEKPPKPTAVQIEVEPQAIPLSPSTPAGTVSAAHAFPSLVVPNTASQPEAKQVLVFGQATPVNRLTPKGGI
jgi:hypothetical protein